MAITPLAPNAPQRPAASAKKPIGGNLYEDLMARQEAETSAFPTLEIIYGNAQETQKKDMVRALKTPHAAYIVHKSRLDEWRAMKIRHMAELVHAIKDPRHGTTFAAHMMLTAANGPGDTIYVESMEKDKLDFLMDYLAPIIAQAKRMALQMTACPTPAI
jgi:hypothetical protein